ncbi:MAG TPA: Hsp33 family molecular chaperone HslO [Bacillota bacterium]|nr:Hsp33 family molecular chaperone HslO [Bacillota bacterium]
MNDYLVKATVHNGLVRAYAIRATEAIEEARKRHDTWATTTAALGRTMTISTMMAAMLKNEQKITVKVEGGGPIGAIIVDSNAKGEVRGYVTNPHVDFELNKFGKLDVARAVGVTGHLSVVKDLGLKDHFTGQVPLVTGEISEDFTYYFAHSEQIPSAVGAGVLINPDHSVKATGGFIIQVMPGADEEFITDLEQQIAAFPAISQLVADGATPEEILQSLFKNYQVNFHEKLPVRFKCQCSVERIKQAISGLGEDEIKKMIEEDDGAEATCHFCNKTYQLSATDLEKLLDQPLN